MYRWILAALLALAATPALAQTTTTTMTVKDGSGATRSLRADQNADSSLATHSVVELGGASVSATNRLPVQSAPITITPSSQGGGTVTTGNTFQTILAANANRTGCIIQNTSTHTAYVYWLGTGTPTLTNSMQIAAGGTFNCSNPGGGWFRTAIQWTGTTGDAFMVSESQ